MPRNALHGERVKIGAGMALDTGVAAASLCQPLHGAQAGPLPFMPWRGVCTRQSGSRRVSRTGYILER